MQTYCCPPPWSEWSDICTGRFTNLECLSYVVQTPRSTVIHQLHCNLAIRRLYRPTSYRMFGCTIWLVLWLSHWKEQNLSRPSDYFTWETVETRNQGLLVTGDTGRWQVTLDDDRWHWTVTGDTGRWQVTLDGDRWHWTVDSCSEESTRNTIRGME